MSVNFIPGFQRQNAHYPRDNTSCSGTICILTAVCGNIYGYSLKYKSILVYKICKYNSHRYYIHVCHTACSVKKQLQYIQYKKKSWLNLWCDIIFCRDMTVIYTNYANSLAVRAVENTAVLPVPADLWAECSHGAAGQGQLLFSCKQC